MLNGKTVVLGVCGSIAAYKTADLASALKKLGADVHVIMTKNATNIINPIAFESLTGNKCMVDTFDRNFQFNIAHISIAQKADVCLIAPASANVIGKIANGIADDMLTTTVMAMNCRVMISPAMNVNMIHNKIVQDNLSRLENFGYEIIPPESGYLACGTVGDGKMPSKEVLLEYILREVEHEKDLKGFKVLVTAGPTREDIDPVRYITNHSTGRMGYAIAGAAMKRGANVTLVSGPVELKKPLFIDSVDIKSAEDMFEVVSKRADENDIIIKAAAVADYTPSKVAENKIKKSDGNMSIELNRTKDILKWLGEHKRENQVICGFSMETENVIENSRAKLLKKNADMIAANSLREKNAGFGTDTNHIVLIEKDRTTDIPMMSKEEAANKLLDRILQLIKNKQS